MYVYSFMIFVNALCVMFWMLGGERAVTEIEKPTPFRLNIIGRCYREIGRVRGGDSETGLG